MTVSDSSIDVSPTSSGSLAIEDVKPQIGSIVRADRQTLLTPESARICRELLEERAVVVFPGIGFSDEEQLAFTDLLGDRLNITSRVPGKADAEEVYQVTLDKGAKIEPEYVLGTYFWHMDGLTVDVTPPLASILSARKLPAKGGDTEFANTRAAYEALSDEMKAELEGLRVRHTVTASLREFVREEDVDEVRRGMGHEHPLVWTHANGTRSLVMGSTADQVVGMSQAEGRALLARLLEWAGQPAFTYRHKWQVGDCVVWHNTSALHRAIPYASDSGRMMHRTAIGGVEAGA